jgi:DNA-binding XRE family transcriptional regulator
MSVHTRKLHIKRERLKSKIEELNSLKDLDLLNQLIDKILPDTVAGSKVHGPEIEDPKLKVGIYLRGLRAKEDISQQELCKKIKVKQPNLSAWENGREPIPLDKAKKIAKLLKGSLKLLGH